MKAGPPGCSGLNATEAQIFQFKRTDKGIDRANRVIFINPVVETLRQD